MGHRPPSHRRAVGALQFQEVGAAGFLVWIAIHVPSAGLLLAGASVGLVAWAVIADGPLGIVHLIGLTVHQRGLVVIGAALGVLPVVSGHVTDPVVVLPCLIVAALLVRNGLVRWNAKVTGQGQAGSSDAAPGRSRIEPPASTGTTLPDGTRYAIRRAGRATGRAGTVVARHADVAVPAGARAAGKVVGRFRRAPNR